MTMEKNKIVAGANQSMDLNVIEMEYLYFKTLKQVITI